MTTQEETLYVGLEHLTANCLGCMSQKKTVLLKSKEDQAKSERAVKKQKLNEDREKRKAEKERIKALNPEELKKLKEEKKKVKAEKKASTPPESPKKQKDASPSKKRKREIELSDEDKKEINVVVKPIDPSLTIDENSSQLRLKGTCPHCHKKVSCFISVDKVSDKDILAHLKMSREEFERRKKEIKESAAQTQIQTKQD